MLKSIGSDPSEWEGSYIHFSLEETLPTRKTVIWRVTSKSGGDFLGKVQWFSRWRKYVFIPQGGCVFEEVCLCDIAEFLVWTTSSHKKGI